MIRNCWYTTVFFDLQSNKQQGDWCPKWAFRSPSGTGCGGRREMPRWLGCPGLMQKIDGPKGAVPDRSRAACWCAQLLCLHKVEIHIGVSKRELTQPPPPQQWTAQQFIFLESANFSAESVAFCLMRAPRSPVEASWAACTACLEYQTALAPVPRPQPATPAPAPPPKSPLPPCTVALLQTHLFPGGRNTPAIQQYVSKTFSMTTQGHKQAASSEPARERP